MFSKVAGLPKTKSWTSLRKGAAALSAFLNSSEAMTFFTWFWNAYEERLNVCQQTKGNILTGQSVQLSSERSLLGSTVSTGTYWYPEN